MNRVAFVLCHFVVVVTLAAGAVFILGTYAHVIRW